MPMLLSRIRLYPIKSMDAVEVREAELLPHGNLRHDRRYVLVDEQQKVINGKRLPLLHRIRCDFKEDVTSVAVGWEGESRRTEFSLQADRGPLEQWFSDALSMPVTLIENSETGFPDDTDAPGPTLVSVASLRAAASWFPGLDEGQIRGRMRANLEIDGCPPFWEDRLVAEAPVAFRVGRTVLLGVNACARCVVPSRNPHTGEPREMFREIFIARRREQLPAWATARRFDHFFRFTVNTRGRRAGHIRCGDVVELE